MADSRISEQDTEREYAILSALYYGLPSAYTDAFAFNRLEANMIKDAYLADQIDMATAEDLWRDLRHRFYRISSKTTPMSYQ